MWFQQLTGFQEESPAQVRANLAIEDNVMISRLTGKSYQFGSLEVPTLAELKARAMEIDFPAHSRLKVKQIVADVQQLHKEPGNKGAMFQAASQFNLLEMIGPEVRPEDGIDRYEFDRTQGPACAIACGAGTIYRNYFAEVNGQTGQTQGFQIDCLDEIGQYLNNEAVGIWEMKNGYALASANGLALLNEQLNKFSDQDREYLKGLLKIGIQWDTEVTLDDANQMVSQAYCSALPVAYSAVDPNLWEPFARIILEAAYEATFWATLINWNKTGSKRLFLTLLGGGAFGNDTSWIMEAINKALMQFNKFPLEVYIVSYGKLNPAVSTLIQKYA